MVISNITKNATSNRIPEIDGLRALAVTMVILYHFRFNSLPVPGGFLGVDIFFVISGFVITRKIFFDLRGSRFKILEFYRSRLVRLYPAFFITLVTTSVFAATILLPDELSDYVQSYLSSIGLVSNFFFWRTTGYFNPSVDFLPLIHIWSLSVEEQYYLIFPFVILFLFKSRKSPRIFFGFLFITSLTLSLALIHQYPVATFYLLPFRIWEFVLGSLIAIILQEREALIKAGDIKIEILSILCLIAVVLPQINPSNFFTDEPYSQFIVVLAFGILLLLIPRTNYLNHVLNFRALQSLGLTSYSVYLVHQPILALWRHTTSGELSELEKVFSLILTLAFGYGLTFWIEKPLRKIYIEKQGNRFLLNGFMASALIFLAVGGILVSSIGTFKKYSNEQESILAFKSVSNQPNYDYGKCFLGGRNVAQDFSSECVGKAGEQRSTLLIGDSHAAMIANGLKSRVEKLSRLSFTGCFALAPTKILPAHCNSVFRYELEVIERLKPDKIVLAGNWLNGTFRTKYGEDALISSISHTVQVIHKISPKSIIFIVGNSPQWSPDLPSVLVRQNIPLKDGEMIFTPDFAPMMALDQSIKASIKDGRVIFVDILGNLCTTDGFCQAVGQHNGKIEPYAFDDSHTTNFGSTALAEIIYEKLNTIKSD